jgi:two-component system, OmpR family, KDP operon response regulator KdpE
MDIKYLINGEKTIQPGKKMEQYPISSKESPTDLRVERVSGEKGMDLDAIYQKPQRQRILIVDDDADTVQLLKEILRVEGFDVYGATSRDEALRKCAEIPPNLVLLDLMMPDYDGWDTFDHLRKVTNAPVIVISAKDSKNEVVHGLQLGIDDYLTKPFFNAEVVARIRTVLRRAASNEATDKLVFPNVDLVVDRANQEVFYRGHPVHLSKREFAILAALAGHAPRSVSNETIAREVWGEDSPEARKRIKYLIYLLRKKLEKQPSVPELIMNNEAYGYRLEIQPEG